MSSTTTNEKEFLIDKEEKNSKTFRLYRFIMGCIPHDRKVVDHNNKNTYLSGVPGVGFTQPESEKSPYWYAEFHGEKTKTFSTSIYGIKAKGFAIQQRHLWQIKYEYRISPLKDHPERILYTDEMLKEIREKNKSTQ